MTQFDVRRTDDNWTIFRQLSIDPRRHFPTR